MRVNYLVVAILLFLLSILVLVFFRGLPPPIIISTDVPENQVPEFGERYEAIRRDYNSLKREYRYLERLAKAAVEIILAEDVDREQLVKLAQTQWEYDIHLYEVGADGLVLGNKLPLSTLETVEVGSHFEISFGERWYSLETEILPENIMQLGALSGVYIDHFQIFSPVSYETVRTDGGTVHGEQYRFQDVPAGTEIKLVLSPELQARIGHPSGTIIIQVI